MARKLQYFNGNVGRAEFIRYMLHYGKLDFNDVRHDHTEWPIKHVKESLPYGSMPVYEEDGRVLNQSLAIARYVGSQVGLVPSDPWEQAKLDAAVYNINDMQNQLRPYYMERDAEKKAANKKNVDEVVDYFLRRFEKELLAGKGHFGGKLTWADFILVSVIKMLNFLFQDSLEKHYPTIQALMFKIFSLPGVKEYYELTK